MIVFFDLKVFVFYFKNYTSFSSSIKIRHTTCQIIKNIYVEREFDFFQIIDDCWTAQKKEKDIKDSTQCYLIMLRITGAFTDQVL